ncbi:hypothetical protein [Aureibacillus halotolerans]|uniref:Uncharacterized protein n=1 Tax=Aureibacillus halotolerans TaxID=1508390 RepID=A0A4R6TL41_9BACI|nr:hypothetical protein [Aureibacillus halotolerans]TDQ32152.1 hypothetical protein EV213_13315 [Aureibacillus halotolerans]
MKKSEKMNENELGTKQECRPRDEGPILENSKQDVMTSEDSQEEKYIIDIQSEDDLKLWLWDVDENDPKYHEMLKGLEIEDTENTHVELVSMDEFTMKKERNIDEMSEEEVAVELERMDKIVEAQRKVLEKMGQPKPRMVEVNEEGHIIVDLNNEADIKLWNLEDDPEFQEILKEHKRKNEKD